MENPVKKTAESFFAITILIENRIYNIAPIPKKKTWEGELISVFHCQNSWKKNWQIFFFAITILIGNCIQNAFQFQKKTWEGELISVFHCQKTVKKNWQIFFLQSPFWSENVFENALQFQNWGGWTDIVFHSLKTVKKNWLIFQFVRSQWWCHFFCLCFDMSSVFFVFIFIIFFWRAVTELACVVTECRFLWFTYQKSYHLTPLFFQ